MERTGPLGTVITWVYYAFATLADTEILLRIVSLCLAIIVSLITIFSNKHVQNFLKRMKK